MRPTRWMLLLIVASNLHVALLGASSEGEKRVEFLLTSLESSPSFKVRLAAATELGKLANGTVADWMLRAFRKEENPAVRLAILYSVANIPEPLVIPPLLELSTQELLNPDELLVAERIVWNFRTAIHQTLWAQELLNPTSSAQKTMAAYVLGLTANASVIPVFARVLKDPNVPLRLRVAQALGRIGSPTSVPLCKQLATSDADTLVRKAADSCLHEVSLVATHQLSNETARRVDLKLELRDLPPNSVSPMLVQAYLRKNVNPRELDRAIALLQKNQVEERTDPTVSLGHIEDLKHHTIKIRVDLVTAHRFQTIDLNRFREIIQDNIGYINQCYLAALKSQPKLAGNVTAKFLVLDSGIATAVDIEDATLKNIDVHECIAKRIQDLHFPKMQIQYVAMKYTFSFTPPKAEKYSFGE